MTTAPLSYPSHTSSSFRGLRWRTAASRSSRSSTTALQTTGGWVWSQWPAFTQVESFLYVFYIAHIVMSAVYCQVWNKAFGCIMGNLRSNGRTVETNPASPAQISVSVDLSLVVFWWSWKTQQTSKYLNRKSTILRKIWAHTATHCWERGNKKLEKYLLLKGNSWSNMLKLIKLTVSRSVTSGLKRAYQRGRLQAALHRESCNNESLCERGGNIRSVISVQFTISGCGTGSFHIWEGSISWFIWVLCFSWFYVANSFSSLMLF